MNKLVTKPSLEKKSTYHEGSGPLGSRHDVVRDPQSESFIMVLV